MQTIANSLRKLTVTKKSNSPVGQDNVDHNLETFTGKKGTFHGMGVISVCASDIVRQGAVKQPKESRKEASFVKNRGMTFVNRHGQSYNGLLKLKFRPVVHLPDAFSLTAERSYNPLRQSSWISAHLQILNPNGQASCKK